MVFFTGCVLVLPPEQTVFLAETSSRERCKDPVSSRHGSLTNSDDSVVNNKVVTVAVQRPPQPSKHSPQTSINSTRTCQKHGLLGLTPNLLS